jgi:hypothetical protein
VQICISEALDASGRRHVWYLPWPIDLFPPGDLAGQAIELILETNDDPFCTIPQAPASPHALFQRVQRWLSAATRYATRPVKSEE